MRQLPCTTERYNNIPSWHKCRLCGHFWQLLRPTCIVIQSRSSFRRSSSLWHPATTVSPPEIKWMNEYCCTFSGSSRCDRVMSLLRDRHWLSVKQHVEYKLCTMVHCCLYGDAPAYLVDLITTSAAATGRASLRSAASGAVAVPRTTSSFRDRSFAAAGPRAWNKLPPPLRRVHSATSFKRQLKTFLFNNAFNLHC